MDTNDNLVRGNKFHRKPTKSGRRSLKTLRHLIKLAVLDGDVEKADLLRKALVSAKLASKRVEK